MIPCLLERSLRDEYETVDSNIKKWEERLQNAFQKKTSFMEDLQEALSYKQTSEELRVFFDKIEKLATKILSHPISKDFWVEQLLLTCSKEKDLKKDLCLSGSKGVEQTKQTIEKLHEMHKHTSELNLVKTNSADTSRIRNQIQNPGIRSYNIGESAPKTNSYFRNRPTPVI